MTATLVQTLTFGRPLPAALRNLAIGMRQQLLTCCEKQAFCLPVILTTAMILLIFPPSSR